MRYNPNAPTTSKGPLLPAGQYEATVRTAKEGTSKAGNSQMGLILTVYGPSGEETDVFDYLPATDSSFWKLKHFCESAGIPVDGDLLEHQAEGVNVRVDLKVERSAEYGESNKVRDYLPRSGNGPTVEYNKKPALVDQDIPF